jgi:hypothetical protein
MAYILAMTCDCWYAQSTQFTHFIGLSKPWKWIMENVEISNPIQQARFGPLL